MQLPESANQKGVRLTLLCYSNDLPAHDDCTLRTVSGWTPSEDALIFEQQSLLGNKWSRIAKARTEIIPLVIFLLDFFGTGMPQ